MLEVRNNDLLLLQNVDQKGWQAQKPFQKSIISRFEENE